MLENSGKLIFLSIKNQEIISESKAERRVKEITSKVQLSHSSHFQQLQGIKTLSRVGKNKKKSVGKLQLL